MKTLKIDLKTHLSFLMISNRFILFVRKDVYPYKFMNDWGNFHKTSLPEKEQFYSNLNLENITDLDYNHPN